MKYCSKVIENVVKNAENKQIHYGFPKKRREKASLNEALALKKVYDDNWFVGLMYCVLKTDNLLNSEIKDLIELFEMHDQIFILNEDKVYKPHITKENIHKLFFS